jgi:hypothetical protein
VDTAAWVSGPGLPETSPAIHSERLDAVEGEIERFVAGADPAALETAGWTTHEWLHFLRNLSPPLAADRMAALDDAFGLTATGNSEILFAWLRLAIRSDYEPAYPRLEEFLTSMGRRKFLKPLYTDLAATEEGKARARAIYEEARPRYHSLAVATVDEILE